MYLIRKHLAAGSDGLPDSVFWDGFAGLAIVAPAVILPALAAPWAGLLLGVLAVGCRCRLLLLDAQGLQPAGRPGAPPGTSQPATRRPRPGTAALLARWQRYELDPAHSIDYPAMSDPRQPETAALIRAMKDAERLRGGTDAGYAPAVDRLEQALADAERAAGVGHETPARPAGLPTRIRRSADLRTPPVELHADCTPRSSRKDIP